MADIKEKKTECTFMAEYQETPILASVSLPFSSLAAAFLVHAT